MSESSEPSECPYRIYNIGRGEPVKLMDFIKSVEEALGKKAQLNLLPMQEGDVLQTWASTDSLKSVAEYKLKVALSDGVKKFVEWYKEHYAIHS